MGTTGTYGFPFPEDTDPVAQGAAAIEALAEAVDDALDTVSGGAGAPILVDRGSYSAGLLTLSTAGGWAAAFKEATSALRCDVAATVGDRIEYAVAGMWDGLQSTNGRLDVATVDPSTGAIVNRFSVGTGGCSAGYGNGAHYSPFGFTLGKDVVAGDLFSGRVYVTLVGKVTGDKKLYGDSDMSMESQLKNLR